MLLVNVKHCRPRVKSLSYTHTCSRSEAYSRYFNLAGWGQWRMLSYMYHVVQDAFSSTNLSDHFFVCR